MKPLTAMTQSTNITYELQSLGWKSFQDLCFTITSKVLGQTNLKFLPSRDGGRDGAFYGSWIPDKGEEISGPFTVQCKFTYKRDKSLSITNLRDELKKAESLASRNLANSYILMTNYYVSGIAEEKIRKSFQAINGIEIFLLFGCDWITSKISESPHLRAMVPRVYGLGDLSQILDERTYSQTREILISMGEELSKFVVTDVYAKCVEALLKRRFILLLGEPASGKSTIAAILAMVAIDQWGCSTLKICDSDGFMNHWNPHEPHQFFWIDDAFGVTQYQRFLVDDWNRIFPHINAAINKGARILFTSRDYIYRAALNDLKISAFPLIEDSQVVINVQELSILEREKILYNHIKLGDQPIAFRTQIKPILPHVAENSKFLPEIARRLGNQMFTKNLVVNTDSIIEYVENPLQFLIEVVQKLDLRSRAAIALIFIHGGALKSPISFAQEDEQTLVRIGASSAEVITALRAMNGSFVKLVQEESQGYWKFKHPSISDAFASIVAGDPELLDIYLAGTIAEKLAAEVICGAVELEGAKVIIPISHYDTFISRIKTLPPDILFTFLSSRCDKGFMHRYITDDISIFERIFFPSFHPNNGRRVSLLSRLYEFDLLPEEWRIAYLEAISYLAIAEPNADFLWSKEMRSLLKEEEISQILEKVRIELIPVLSDVIDDWEQQYSNIDFYPGDRPFDPGDWFSYLIETLTSFRSEFAMDKDVQDAIDDAFSDIDRSIDNLRDHYFQHWYDDDDYERYKLDQSAHTTNSERSIFEDIDK